MVIGLDGKLIAANSTGYAEKDIDAIKFQFILKKIHDKEQISKSEMLFYKEYSSQHKYQSIRSDAFIKYVFGLYCWDQYKSSNSYKYGYYLYQDYQSRCNKCKGSKCFKEMNYDGQFAIPKEIESTDFYCKNIETCKKFVREAFKLVSTCIQDCKLHNSKHAASAIYPESNIYYDRKKLSFFQ